MNSEHVAHQDLRLVNEVYAHVPPASHTHAAADVTSGSFPLARINIASIPDGTPLLSDPVLFVQGGVVKKCSLSVVKTLFGVL